MRIYHAAFVSALALAPVWVFGQADASAPAGPSLPSAMLQPALTDVEGTLNALKIDKWKKGSVRDEAGSNVDAMLRDLKTNVPPLLSAADAAPGSLSKSIPLMKHLDALYDVFLRVEEASRISAPSDQIDQLAQTLKTFGVARIGFYDSLAQNAAGQEKQLGDLATALKAEQAKAEEHKPAPAAVPCTPPKPAVKKKRVPAKKPATPPANQAPPAQQPKTQ